MSTTPATEPRNPFYFLLLLACLVFLLTIFAYLFVPFLEQKAREAGQTPPPSPFRDSLRESGWVWLLWETVPIIAFGLLSMGLDRYRSLRKEREEQARQTEKTLDGDTPKEA